MPFQVEKYPMNKLRPVIFLVLAVVLFDSCRTIKELKSLSKCEFRIQSVVNTQLAGINIQNMRKFSDLNFAQGARITSAYMSGNLPLTFTLNVQVRNPNTQLAALNRLEWIALFDQTELVNGTVNQRVAIAPNGGVATLPLNVSCNLKSVLNRLQKDNVLNSGFELANERREPKRLALKLKPSISVGKKGKSIPYPGYITVKKDFVSN